MKRIYCGIDFGTSNSTVGVSDLSQARLLPLEGGRSTLPSAIFFNFSDHNVLFGRSAIDAYVDGEEGRLMRALKSVLGTSLIHETTRIRRKLMTFTDILGSFFAFLKARLEHEVRQDVQEVVLGRPVRFVDADDVADATAQQALEAIARSQGFRHVTFQYEPIAAALDYEQRVTREELALIVDIGGGTSDFSIVRVSPERAGRAERKQDILANGGVHIGGTDFDRLLSLARVMPHFGFGTWTKDRKRNLPSRYFHDLATWHCINSLYHKKVMTELRQVRYEAERRDLIERLIRIVQDRRGHTLALETEQAKIELTSRSTTTIDLASYCDGETIHITRSEFNDAIENSVERIMQTVHKLLSGAGLRPGAISTIFVTGGSSSVPMLRDSIVSLFPSSLVVKGDLLGSVGVGLALDARRKFG
ncbi:hypothetical chaperone protein [Rhizobiales bacterium GAS113]|nr:hypothetical chaperone protein [Rhizobiales bacterium GAS113]